MEAFITALFSVCIVIGLITIVKDIVSTVLHRPAAPAQIRFSVKNRADNIEATLRMLLYRNPHAEITVVDCGSTDDTAAIIEKLALDFPHIHLEYAEKLHN